MKRTKPLFPTTEPLRPEQARGNLRNSTSERSRSVKRTATEIVLLLVILMGGGAAYYYGTRSPFNSQQWKSHQDDITIRSEIRARMYDDLLPRLSGRNRSEILLMLGPSDAIADRNASPLKYYVGFNRMLIINFDDQQRVSNHQIRKIS